MLVHELNVRVLTHAGGEILASFMINPDRNYQPKPNVNDVPRHL